MTDRIDRNTGLDQGDSMPFTEVARVRIADDAVAQGYALPEQLKNAANLFSGAPGALLQAWRGLPRIRVRNPALAALGLSLVAAQNAPAVELTWSSGGQPRVQARGGAAGQVVDTGEAASTLLWLPAGSAATVEIGDERYEVRREASEYVVSRAAGRAFALEPAPALQAPLLAWASASDDAWLAERMRELAAAGTPWATLVGAGLLDRHAQCPREQRRQLLEALRTNRVDAKLQPARAWWGTLDAEQAAFAAQLVAAQAVQLRHEVADLEETWDPSRASWRAALLRLFEAREELESAWLLVRPHASSADDPAALRQLDEDGSRLARKAPAIDEAEAAEELRRAASFDPDAWWLEHAAP